MVTVIQKDSRSIKRCRKLFKKIQRSKRLKELKRAVKNIPCLGIWDLTVSARFGSSLTITGDGLGIVYIKPHKGLFWFDIIEINDQTWNFLYNKNKPVSFNDLIKAINYKK